MTTEGTAAKQLDPKDELDADTLAGIRSLMEEEGPAAPPARAQRKRAAPTPKPKTAAPVAPAQTSPPPAPEMQAAPVPPAQNKQPAVHQFAPADDGGFVARQKARVLAYRPTPKHIFWTVTALLVFFRPWLVVGLIVFTLLLIMGIFLILGYDGFWRRGMALARWYARRRPSRAAILHKKLDNFAVKWDAILDRFPEGTVDGLYLPDFGELAEADARHDAALERRLESLRETQS